MSGIFALVRGIKGGSVAGESEGIPSSRRNLSLSVILFAGSIVRNLAHEGLDAAVACLARLQAVFRGIDTICALWWELRDSVRKRVSWRTRNLLDLSRSLGVG